MVNIVPQTLITMIPFRTTVLIAGAYAEYEIALGDDQYKATLVQYHNEGVIVPEEVLFWQEGKTWVSDLKEQNSVPALLGIAVDIYLYKAAAYELFS